MSSWPRALRPVLVAALAAASRVPLVLRGPRSASSAAALALFALVVLLQFVLVERLFSRGVAWMATLFLLLPPPAFVPWSLGTADGVGVALLAGTATCLAFDIWRRTAATTALVATVAAALLGAWAQPIVACYLLALALAILENLPRRRALAARLFGQADTTRWPGLVLALAGAATALLLVIRQAPATPWLHLTQVSVPMLLGFRGPAADWLGVPAWLAVAPVAAATVAVIDRRPRTTSVFHFLVIAALLLLVVGGPGAFSSARSCRYVAPAYAGLAVVMAIGVARVFRWSRTVGIVLLSAIAVTFAVQERAWSRGLPPLPAGRMDHLCTFDASSAR